MTYEEAVALCEGLRTRFDEPFSPSDKATIERLYAEAVGRDFRPTSCQMCYHDALIEIYHTLKKNRKMADKCNYRLRAGYLINSPTFRGGAIYSNDNLTDEVAEEFLTAFPERVDMFQQLPKTEEKAEEGENTPVTGTKTQNGVTTKGAPRKAVRTKNQKK